MAMLMAVRYPRLRGRHDPYSASKAGAEIGCKAYRRSFCATRVGIGLADAGAANVARRGDWAVAQLAPDRIGALVAGKPVIPHPTAKRPWRHAQAPLSGYFSIGIALVRDTESFARAGDIGPELGWARVIAPIAKALVNARESNEVFTRLESNAPHQVSPLSLIIDKTRDHRRWIPRSDVDQALVETVAWYRTVYQGGLAEAVPPPRIYACMSSLT